LSAVNLTVRFACEVAALAAFVWWGWPVVGILAAVAVAVVWGSFVGPKARRRLRDPLRLAVELVIFALAVAALVGVGHPVLGAVYGVAALVTAVLVRRWPEPVVTSR
jgi:uncharacterized membrane protein YfcA